MIRTAPSNFEREATNLEVVAARLADSDPRRLGLIREGLGSHGSDWLATIERGRQEGDLIQSIRSRLLELQQKTPSRPGSPANLCETAIAIVLGRTVLGRADQIRGDIQKRDERAGLSSSSLPAKEYLLDLITRPNGTLGALIKAVFVLRSQPRLEAVVRQETAAILRAEADEGGLAESVHEFRHQFELLALDVCWAGIELRRGPMPERV